MKDKLTIKNEHSIIENYQDSLAIKEGNKEELFPIVKSLKGVFKLPKSFDYKKELAERLLNKYL